MQRMESETKIRSLLKKLAKIASQPKNQLMRTRKKTEKVETDMNQFEWNLKDFARETVTIKEVFLTRAIEDFVIAQKYRKFDLDHPNDVVKYHYAISSLIFSFLFIDNMINYYYKELFTHSNAKLYILEKDRSFLLKQALSNWRALRVANKYKIIHYVITKSEPEPELISKLNEFSNFRNLIVHGYCYQRDLLLQTTIGDGCAWQDIFDYEDIHEEKPWENRFPILKFHTPDSIWIDDSQKALTVLFDCLAPIIKVTNEEFAIIPSHPQIDFNVLKYNCCKIDSLLEKIPNEIKL